MKQLTLNNKGINMPEVKIVKEFSSGEYEPSEIRNVNIFIDGKMVGSGSFGGEPEDNSEGRDYAWVIPTIKSLASSLGANVTEESFREE